MTCEQVQSLLSAFLENEVTGQERRRIAEHLAKCDDCLPLKEEMERMISTAPALQEELPFFLKNRLYNIFEAVEEKEAPQAPYLKLVAATVGTLVLFLNLFYFTNIFPAANRTLHIATAKIEQLVVETGAFFEKLKDSGGNPLLSLMRPDEQNEKPKSEKKKNENGGKNG